MDPYRPDGEGDWPEYPQGLQSEGVLGDPVDEMLARRVAHRFLADPAIGSGHVVVAVQNRVVILEGRLDSRRARDAAGQQAWAIPGVFDVSNRLLVPD
ncbi:BON domain-containing protein [Jidongwangia harbinensis]|uniref:BON domain-containing protein n=1 Tax=Jidongwangia harbinensis TaxID=2878561 RepID=UPI001CD9E1BB|nr:BON domain-containing protein [Jidongwangia harbinensis]MCA2219035.1 BON domain-containing protein [Jidongwangia harbinensis]